ncbi:ATP synthase subunit I [Streptomyces sp. NPDC026092]|uniref:ATP synthase subunit I n=1 Tax=Streptomyces sp. NPDC026092 TaxID=3154797 RepID=UPI003410C0BB
MSPRATPEHPVPGHAVCLDLRAPLHDPDGVVRAALEAPQPPGDRRFVVLDDAEMLVAHQLLHERLSSYGPARIICLAVGAPGRRTLHRSLTLRPRNAGVLWLLDEPDDAALRPLVDIVSGPEVFGAVLRALAEVVHGVAVPSARVLEHDLTEEARARSWRQAVEGLAGPDVPAQAPSTDGAPAELALLLDESVPRSLAGHDWLPAHGRAGGLLLTCEEAWDDAVEGHARVRGPAGFLAGADRSPDLPGEIERLAGALKRLRTAVADTFAVAGGARLTAEHRGHLRDRGVELPEMPREISRAGIVPALRDHTYELIGRGLPLRSVAARLAALSSRTAPAGSAARLQRLDEICPPEDLHRMAAQQPFTAGGSRPVALVVTGVLALLAGLWPGAGWALGPGTGVLAAVLAHLMLRRRPNRSPDGRLDGGGSTGAAPRLFGGVVGGILGAAVGQLVGLPLWAGAVTAVLAVGAVVGLALRDWTRAVDDWWARMDPGHAGPLLKEIQDLVITTAVHDWLFADVRHHCAEGAGAVARLLRGLAATADAYAYPYEGNGPGSGRAHDHGPERTAPSGGADAGTGTAPGEAWSWGDWADSAGDDLWSDGPDEDDLVPEPRKPESPAPAKPLAPTGASGDPAPAWLERRHGDGGPALVDTLLADLVEGTVRILDGCWAGIERDPANAGRLPLDERLTELLDETRVRLERDVAASPPPGSGDRRDRPDAARLTGVAPDAVARLIAADDDPDHTVPMCGPEHLRLLSHDPGAVRQVRFVPETMRRGATGDDIWRGTGEDVEWTRAGRHAGVLRLVPLRPDVVRIVRAEEAGTP